MTDTKSLVAAENLRTALEATANALAQSNLDGLLEAETALTNAFAGLSTLRAAEGAANGSALPDALRDDLLAAQAALVRCRRLGTALGEFVRLSFDARGQSTTYNLAATVANELTGRGFHTRA